MGRYDPKLLQELADQTQAQAATAVLGGIAAGAVTGCLFGYAANLMFYPSFSLVLPGLILGAVLGIVTGRRRAQALKLQAQMALGQMQIEENTRKTGDAGSVAPP
jgi:F0F1-type ATP synthase assembly protein I